jgi:hypothetical protein
MGAKQKRDPMPPSRLDGLHNFHGFRARNCPRHPACHRSCAPGAGSFVKVELLDAGGDMLAALNDKYNDTTVHGGGAIAGTTGKAVPVLLVGDEKIRCVQLRLRALALSR